MQVTVLNRESGLGERVLHLEGNHYQQDVTHGHLARDLIAQNLSGIRSWISRDNTLGPTRILDLVKQNEVFLGTREQEVAEELRGIADGSGLPSVDPFHLPVEYRAGVSSEVS